MKIQSMLIGAAMLSGCGSAAPLAPSAYGIQPGDFEAAATAYFHEQFTKGDGAQVRVVSAPYRAQGRINGMSWSGWATDVKVRAEMPNGRSSGFLPYTVLFEGGEAFALSRDAAWFERAPSAPSQSFSAL
ncbi:MAG: hypothetical protein AAF527_09865 [Pseudomonadota bacterium]